MAAAIINHILFYSNTTQRNQVKKRLVLDKIFRIGENLQHYFYKRQHNDYKNQPNYECKTYPILK